MIILSILGGKKPDLQSSEAVKPVKRDELVIQLITFSDGSTAVVPINPHNLRLHDMLGMLDMAQYMLRKALDEKPK